VHRPASINFPLKSHMEYGLMTATTETNGRVRKSLSDQIDRLDGILDGLAEGLNEAIVTAVKEAVGAAVHEAVRAVLTELLGNSELLHTIRDSLVPPIAPGAHPAQPTDTKATGAGASVFVSRCWVWTRARVLATAHCLRSWRDRVRTASDAAWKCLRSGGRFVGRLWRPLLIAVGIGAVVGMGAYLLGPWLSTAAGGLAGFTTSLAVQARVALRQALGCVAPARG
jgi:hypothetical protein